MVAQRSPGVIVIVIILIIFVIGGCIIGIPNLINRGINYQYTIYIWEQVQYLNSVFHLANDANIGAFLNFSDFMLCCLIIGMFI